MDWQDRTIMRASSDLYTCPTLWLGSKSILSPLIGVLFKCERRDALLFQDARCALSSPTLRYY